MVRKKVGYMLVKSLARAVDKGKTYVELGRKYGLRADVISAHVQAYNKGSWSQSVTGPVHAARKNVRAYEKDALIDPAVALKREREEKLFRTQALNAIRDAEGLRFAAQKLAEDKLNLELLVHRLQEKQVELEGELMALRPLKEGLDF